MSFKPQSQAALLDQLKQLVLLANREGLYDAADYLAAHYRVIERPITRDPAHGAGGHDAKHG